MPQQPQPSVVNNFNQGFKTEYTGLNFPENASTDTRNCVFNRIGNVTRRLGINYEANFNQPVIDRTGKAINTFRWKNVGGDGLTQIVVTQVGNLLRFYRSSSATINSPLSSTLLGTQLDISQFKAAGGTFDATAECQFADGNGYLFVFHPSCDPFYCTYNAGSITATKISVQIRDFIGVPENPPLATTDRPVSLSTTHNYNLTNQGWGQAGSARSSWSSSITGSPLTNVSTGSKNFTISTGLNITAGDGMIIYGSGSLGSDYWVGTVTSYTGGTGAITVSITAVSGPDIQANAGTMSSTNLVSSNKAIAWNAAFSPPSNWPSNADIWFEFKDSSGAFAPASTVNNVALNSPAPQGSIILEAFNQQRTGKSGVAGLTDISTTVRPRTGTFFQGRVWYTGVDASFQPTGTAPYTTWTENIYFSQIIENATQFGNCYQLNDPTSETLFDLLPTDGGVIVIQGSGSIYKLFPIHNGVIVFAANGVWFITGSTGIGFTATDYTINKISAIQSISSSSFVDVRGSPFWWNEEGVYTVSAGQGTEGLQYGAARGAAFNIGLKVEPVTFLTIQSFYQNIPLNCKKLARGTYDPINWEVRWIYTSTEPAGNITNAYTFDSVLQYNTITQAFSPWTVDTTLASINGIEYVQGPGGSLNPSPTIKYLVSQPIAGPTYKFTFAEENDSTNWVDWLSANGVGVNYTSYFVTGYRIKGMAQHKTQVGYLYLYSNNSVNTSYKLQAVWTYAISPTSGKYTNLERTDITDSTNKFVDVARRYKIRGRGLVNQFRVQSVDGKPFNIIGWSVDDKVNIGV